MDVQFTKDDYHRRVAWTAIDNVRRKRWETDVELYEALKRGRELGFSWAQMARRLYMTRQGLQRWFEAGGRKTDAALASLATQRLTLSNELLAGNGGGDREVPTA